MAPTPTAYLTIGSPTFGYNNYDDVVDVSNVSCTYGRTTLSEQPSPSTFNATITLPDSGDYRRIYLNDRVQWSLDNGSGFTSVFYGFVTDITASVGVWREGQGLINYNITAIGPLLRFSRYYIDTPLSKQYEGTRINDICNAISQSPRNIETPGNYEVAAVSAAYGPALTYAQTAANSGMGLLYEDLDSVNYETYATRSARSVEFTLDSTQVLASGIGTTTSVTTAVNRVNVAYGAGGNTLTTTSVDSNSSTVYGPLFGTRSTELHNSTDAQTQRAIFLKARAYPYAELSAITINLENTNLTSGLRTKLLAVRTGQRIKVALPDIMGSEFDGFIESYTWNVARNQRLLTLQLSNYDVNVPYTTWYNIGSDTWATIATATTQWKDIT